MAADFMHASRADRVFGPGQRRTGEEHVGIDPRVGDSGWKRPVIPHTVGGGNAPEERAGNRSHADDPAAH